MIKDALGNKGFAMGNNKGKEKWGTLYINILIR